MKMIGRMSLAVLCLAANAMAAQIAPISVPKTKSTVFRIFAGDELWFFNQVTTLLNYRTTISLSAIGPNTGTFSWDATTNVNAVKFDNDTTSISKTDDPSLHVTSKEISLTPGDITLRFRYNGALVGDYRLTVFAPSERQFGLGLPIKTRPTNVATSGFITDAIWEVKDQFGFPIPRRMEVNEFFDRDTIRDEIDNNWHSPFIEGADLPPNGKLTEAIGNSTPSFFLDSYTRASGVGFSPVPQNPPLSGPPSAVEVFNVRQRYFAGSEIPGQGRQQQAQVAHWYLDRVDPVVIP